MYGDITFVDGQHIPEKSRGVDQSKRDFYSLKLMTKGKVELWYDQTHYYLEGAWFWTSYPGARIRFHPAHGHTHWEHRFVIFRGARVEHWKAAKLWPEVPQAVPSERDYVTIFDELIVQSQRRDRWGTLRAVNLLEHILIMLAELKVGLGAKEAWLDHTLAVLEKDAKFVPDYERLALECNMALSTLRRQFKRAMGMTLHSYVMRRRMDAACELLGTTDMSVKSIAFHLGYKDPYYFGAQFRQQVGVSPTAYRKRGQHTTLLR